MKTHQIGIIMNGVTGRMGTNQHLVRSMLAMREQGGVKINAGERIWPEPVLTGRNNEKLRALAESHGGLPWSTDLDALLADPKCSVYFDATTTQLRYDGVRKAIAAGKHIYCEKPTANSLKEALDLAQLAEKAGVKNGVVQDKLFLPGFLKLKYLIDTGFFGQILSVRGEFGYWVFTGENQTAQRPSWNYRASEGGGIIMDMLCHWRYVIDNLFGNVVAVNCLGARHIGTRWDEQGRPYDADSEDAAYATFVTDQDVICHFNSSWVTRVRRDDLLTVHVDGTKGSAVAGLRDCVVQHDATTPRPIWNPDIPSPIDYYATWTAMPDNRVYENAFKVQWEMFLRHLVFNEPFRWSLREGAKGVQLAELGHESWKQRRWMDVPKLK
jgi:predicted dehydrogenase